MSLRRGMGRIRGLEEGLEGVVFFAIIGEIRFRRWRKLVVSSVGMGNTHWQDTLDVSECRDGACSAHAVWLSWCQGHLVYVVCTTSTRASYTQLTGDNAILELMDAVGSAVTSIRSTTLFFDAHPQKQLAQVNAEKRVTCPTSMVLASVTRAWPV